MERHADLDHTVDLPGLDHERVVELKMDGTGDEERSRDRVQPVVRSCYAASGWLKSGSLAADPGYKLGIREQASGLGFDEGAGGVVAAGMEQVCGLPQITERVEQVEDLGDLSERLWQVRPADAPPRVLSVHEEDNRLFALALALFHRLGQPHEQGVDLGRGGLPVIALQGGAKCVVRPSWPDEVRAGSFDYARRPTGWPG